MISVGATDYVRGVFLSPKEHRLEVPVSLEENYVLEFIPLSENPGGTMRVRLVSGADSILLKELAVTPLKSYGDNFKRRSEILGNPVRIDLSRFRGQQARIVWTYAGPPASRAAAARIRLRRMEVDTPEKPDILFVCSDTHRYDHALGDKGRVLMPRLHQLAYESSVYRKTYSPASWTLPSIASTLTGLLPRRHLTGHRINQEFDNKSPPPGHMVFKDQLLTTYPAQLNTVTEKLRGENYVTVLVAANWFYFGSGLYADGQDLAFGGARWESVVLAKDTTAGGQNYPGTDRDDGRSLNLKALSILKEIPRDVPLFMIVHYMDVHNWSNRLHRKSDSKKSAIGPVEGKKSYADSVKDCDQYMNELLSVWSSQRGLDKSMIVFFSDHGEHLFEPPMQILFHGHTMQEPLLHVPFVVKYPSSVGIKPQVTDRVVSLVDLAPTILDLVGLNSSADRLDGISLLQASSNDGNESRTLFADYQLFGDELSSVRRGPIKLVINLTRNKDVLMDFSKPSSPTLGERGQMVMDLETRKSLRQAFFVYELDSKKRSQGVKSQHIVDQNESVERLRSLCYLK